MMTGTWRVEETVKGRAASQKFKYIYNNRRYQLKFLKIIKEVTTEIKLVMPANALS
jgi:hypothetical protein